MASTPAKKSKKEKKRRRKSDEEGEEEAKTLTLDGLKTLAHELLSSLAHVNNLPRLLSFLSPSSPLEFALESLISVQSFFVPLLPEIPAASSSSSSRSKLEEEDPKTVFGLWLKQRFDEFINALIRLAVSPHSSEALRDVALDAIMDFVKLGKGGRFQSAIYHRFLQSIIHAASSVDPLVDLLVSKYFKYTDVRYFTYTSMDKIARNFETTKLSHSGKRDSNNSDIPESSGEEIAIHNMYYVLSHLPSLELDKEANYEMWCEFGISSKKGKERVCSKISSTDGKATNINGDFSSTSHVTKKLKSKFTKAWLSFLKLPLPLDVYKEVLATLHQNVIPSMANPAILSDFLTRSYDIGGVVSVMALSGLFILMTQHGLEYPKFYEKLYALLTPSVFMAKHRAVFFQLLDMCLKSTYISASLAAAFAKKLSRLALSVPPSGELIIIAVIHNLLRRHPSLNFLVHWDGEEANADASVKGDQPNENERVSDAAPLMHNKEQGVDLFNSEATDPVKSKAMRSSLWEIDTLRHHYSPAVSRFVASLENDLTVRAKTTEVAVADFSSGSYATVFRDEIRRRIKQVPLAFYRATPTSLFSESDFPGWTFVDQNADKNESKIQENGALNTVESENRELSKRRRVETC
ncbi:Nucleolar complex protein [Ananas comosus]|uniref:Nucleolar complex protein n=1 Tax=Ananas comosus TaxID=4615 RepID=A0A199UK14_ANACO|nr:Nucleolar complex protein [Ananas comosus]